jgi:PKD repeat protein
VSIEKGRKRPFFAGATQKAAVSAPTTPGTHLAFDYHSSTRFVQEARVKRLAFGVLGVALLLSTAPLGASVSDADAVDGTFEVLQACDLAAGTTRQSYRIATDEGEEYELELATPPEGLRTGDRVRVRGRLAGGRMVAASLLPLEVSSAGEERVADSAWTTGTRRVLVMLIKFPGEADPYTQAAAQNTLLLGASSVKNLYAEASYGATSLAGDVTPWMTATVAKPTTCDTTTAANQAKARATDAGYVLANYNLLVYAHTSLPGCGWAGLAYVGGPGAWINGNSFSTLVVGHELGHNLGLWHSHSLNCAGATYGANCEPVGSAGKVGSRSEYGDQFDTMGNSRAAHFNAYQKSTIDWMPAGSIATHASGAADYDLSPLEGTTGTRAVKIPVTGRNYWLEWRQPTGFDSGIGTGGTGGPLLHVGPSSVGGSDLLDGTPATAGTFSDAAIPVGQSFVDSVANLIVTAVSKTASTLRVHVQFGITPPTSDFTFTPASPVSGHAVAFTDTSAGYADSWLWDFGDGQTSTTRNPAHSFAAAGSYNVSLTAANVSGSSAPAVKSVSVTPQAGKKYYTIAPCRLADTRKTSGTYGGPALSAGATRTFPVWSQCGVPATATAVSANVTVTGSTNAGSLTLFAAGTAVPGASTINFARGQTRANSVAVELGASGGISVFGGLPSGTVHVILDVNGYWQ